MMCLSCQLSFQSLEVEESGDCTSDYVTVHRDVEGQEEIGVCPLEPRLPLHSDPVPLGDSFLGIEGTGSSFLHCPAPPAPSLGAHDHPPFSQVRGGKSGREDHRAI